LFPDVTEDTEVESNIVSGSSYNHLGITEENTISHEGLRYIAGYIAYRTKNKYNLGAHTFKMKPEDDNIMQSCIMCLSRGGLTEPDENFLKCCYTMESTFQTYHGPNDLRRSNGIIKDLVDVIRVKVEDGCLLGCSTAIHRPDDGGSKDL
jgi:hypothetical protein